MQLYLLGKMRSSHRFVCYCILLTLCLCTLVFFSPRSDPSAQFLQLTQYLDKLAKQNHISFQEADHVHFDEHIAQTDLSGRVKKTPYPQRENMGACPKLFGKVLIVVVYVKSSMETHYKVAQESLQCYLKTTDYPVAMVDLDNDPRVKEHCGHHQQLFFKKHCATSVYLQDSDWMFVLDADAGVVNPNHCIEEYIDDRVNLIFYERFFNWEIASGNYIAKNTPFTRNFLKKWADWEFIQPQNWNGADNGVLQLHILQTVLPDAQQAIKNCDTIWHQGKDYNTYMAYVTCCKLALGANRLWPGKVRILRRAHGWVRDGFITTDRWSDHDFMLHGWKTQEVGKNGWQSPFTKNLDPSKCGNGYEGWLWRDEKKANASDIRKLLGDFEKSAGKNFPKEARVHPYLQLPDVGECYPFCDVYT